MVLHTTHNMNHHKPIKQHVRHSVGTLILLTGLVVLGSLVGFSLFEREYTDRVYPTVYIDGVAVGGQTPEMIKTYWLSRNTPFEKKQFEFTFESQVATLSAEELGVGYDATLSATQAYLVGRSTHMFSDLYNKITRKEIRLTPYFRWNTHILHDTLSAMAQTIDIPVQDALFQFKNNKVTSFRPSRVGRKVNIADMEQQFHEVLLQSAHNPLATIPVPLPIQTIQPAITTDAVNSFGIQEKIGTGYSEFSGSIPGRIHNVALAASRINGILIKPGETFSFNDGVGDISAATGYQSAYIIKEGRTVLGDGGGVCQVSTTLFRAALNAGLPIVERHAHAYRVHYYEDGGFKAGLDATVFGPTVDLKIKNDTPQHILIQTKTDTKKLTLTIDFYGTHDGRKAEITDHTVWGITAPPPALYQDDPTLPAGVVKQVDFSSWGAKAAFQYTVTKNGEKTVDTKFVSNYRPWQAVYLRGVQ